MMDSASSAFSECEDLVSVEDSDYCSFDDSNYCQMTPFSDVNMEEFSSETMPPKHRNDDKCGSLYTFKNFKSFNYKVNISNVIQIYKLYFKEPNLLRYIPIKSNKKISLSMSFSSMEEAFKFQSDFGKNLFNCMEGLCTWDSVKPFFPNQKNPSKFESNLFELSVASQELDLK